MRNAGNCLSHTTLKKAEPSFSKTLASTIQTRTTLTRRAALRTCGQYKSIRLHVVTFQKSEIVHFRRCTTRKSPFTHRSSANFHYLFPLSQRLETSVFLCSENNCRPYKPRCPPTPRIMTLPISIISANKIVISKKYFIKRSLIAFLEHIMQYQTFS